MNSIVKQIIVGLTISAIILGISITGGLIISDTINFPNFDSEESNYEDTVEVKLANSTINSENIAEQSLDSVVTIYSQNQDNDLDSQGSGFMYNDGYIITNEHVISGMDEYKIEYNKGEWSDAELVGSDEYTDIAVLRPLDTPPSYAESLTLYSELPNRGVPTIALGAPQGLKGTVTSGVVSGTNRNMDTMTDYSIPDTIQTDAALNEGNSGGPLINAESGDVIGLNTATEGENIGFAVSSRMTENIAQSLIDTGNHEHSLVGIRTVELNPLTQDEYNVDVDNGLIIVDVIDGVDTHEDLISDEDNPDVIVGVDGKEINNNEEFISYIMLNTSPGDVITLEVHRNGEIEHVDIKLSSRN